MDIAALRFTQVHAHSEPLNKYEESELARRNSSLLYYVMRSPLYNIVGTYVQKPRA